MRSTAVRWVLWALVLGYTSFLAAHLFEIISIVPNWSSGSPEDVGRYRDFLSNTGPGAFYQLLLPAVLLAAVLGLVLTWADRGSRRLASVSILVIVAYAVWTIQYFVPINRYVGQANYDSAILSSKVAGWVFWEHWRAALVAFGLAASIALLERWPALRRKTP